ncbi:hypothetical protein SESBI_16285 [Sesbania bispinosa]|nr:hypothetical protein SESBI_16285 [Sesbania bispinosa]
MAVGGVLRGGGVMEDGGVLARTPMFKSEKVRVAFQQARMKVYLRRRPPLCINRGILAGKSVRQLQQLSVIVLTRSTVVRCTRQGITVMTCRQTDDGYA